MTRTSKLYPFKIKSQCEKAIAILQKQNENLMRTSECVSAFVNDTDIESLSFDQLKLQCSNYIEVIASIINVNNMDIADYQTLSNAVGRENLDGNRILDNQEKYMRLRDDKYMQESNFRSMAAGCLDETEKCILLEKAESCRYFGGLFDDMYRYWLEKESLFDSIEASTCGLFIGSAAIKASINSCVSRLQNSFRLNRGYDPSTIVPEKFQLDYIEKGDIDTANGIKALNEYLIESGKFSPEERVAIIKGILEQSPERLKSLPNIISVAGTEAGIANIEEMVSLNRHIKNKDLLEVNDEKCKDYIKGKEACVLTVYNNGQTVAYGFDFLANKDIEVIFLDDAKTQIFQEEADRLFDIKYGEIKEEIDTYLKEKGYSIDSYTYCAIADLVYNRDMNALTKEVIDAMAKDEKEKVKELLADFDYRYAKKYLYCNTDNPDVAAQAYVDRNPGLATRRNEEYEMYSEKRYVGEDD